MKKRNLVIGAALVMSMVILPSCDFIEECGTCELVTEDSDGNKTYGTPLPFCGDALTEKDNESPVTINGTTTYWNCY